MDAMRDPVRDDIPSPERAPTEPEQRSAPASGSVEIELARYASELDAFRAALDRQAIVAVTDRRGAITLVNDLFCRISGYRRDELIGRNHRILNSGHHPRRFFVSMWRTIADGRIWHGEICNRAKDGRLYWVDTTIVPRRGADGRIESYVSVRYDITERKQAEAALADEARRRARAETLVREILDAIPDGVAAFDAEDRLVLSNRAFRRLYGAGPAGASDGLTFREIAERCLADGRFPEVGRSPSETAAWLDARLREHRRPGRRHIRQLSDGRWLQVRERRSPSGHIVSVSSDVTALKRAELAVKQRAERDALTGLYNRAAFGERLERMLCDDRRTKPGALVVVDVDGFKAVNDTHGHDVGDALLGAVAERLRAGVRRGDVVARLGGDEFALILPGVTRPRTAEDLLGRLLAQLGAPLDLPGRTLFPSVSLGCAFFPEHGATPDAAMKAADLALYEAKAAAEARGRETGGRGRFRLFAPALRESETRRRALVAGLREALVRDEIVVALQPQVTLRDARHAGFEALARWRRGGEVVPPAAFIPIAEEANLIGAVGGVVLDRALALVRRHIDAGAAPGRVAVNVAAAQLKDERFVEEVSAALARHRLTPAALEIEITETVLLDRAAAEIGGTLARLRALGVGIALDDFGTGYASLAHLRRFPVDRLKIDRGFVEGIGRDADADALVGGIVDLAHGLALEVVAEGIETPAQRAALARMGCDVGQGYLFAPPLPPEEIGTYLERMRPSSLAAAG
ncbi:EAL domain-containing protein [Salinarimonas sp.]|uniref:putative bifunctional diguanylate cyclase/phosphodiesterase n=1 Tax=Salinarimonas sp. TaxID=2766526 RepID=UPI0032D9020E